MRKVIFLMFLLLNIADLVAQYKISHLDTISLKSLGVAGSVSSISDFSFKAVEQNGVVIKGEILGDYPSEDKYKWSDKLHFDENIIERIGHKYDFNLKGKNIKDSEFKTSTTVPYITTSYIYDTSGRVGEVKKHLSAIDYDGEIIQVNIVSKYTYQNGNQIKQIDTYRNQEIWRRAVFEYVGNNLVSKKIFDYDGDIEESHIYEYRDNFLETITIKEFDFEDGESYMSLEKITKLNNEGKIIYEYRKDNQSDGYYKSERLYEYDVLGNKTKEINTTSYKSIDTNYDNIKHIFSYIYSENKLSAIESANKQGKVYHITNFKYLSGEKIVEVSVNVENNLTKKRYFDNGLLTKLEDESGNVYNYSYKFDSKGNWTRVTEYKNTIPIKMRVREIKYHQK